MAETPEPQATGQEPSMEEILASIRKIITDETPAPAANGAEGADVIELTQMVQEDGSVVEVKPPPAPAHEKAATPPPPPPPEPAMTKPPEKAAAPSSPPPAAPAPGTLVSEPNVTAAATALSSLASTVEIERLAHAPTASITPIGNGARTLEDMVIELMRPLLKDWLDKNLPATVDRLVQKEIERISRKVQD